MGSHCLVLVCHHLSLCVHFNPAVRLSRSVEKTQILYSYQHVHKIFSMQNAPLNQKHVGNANVVV